MQINAQTLPILQRMFDAKFQSGYTRTPIFHDKLVVKESTDVGAITYGWLDRIPRMRKWVGERVYNNIAQREMTYQVEDFEDTVEIPRNDILDDRLGVTAPKLEMLGMAAKKGPDVLLANVMRTATELKTYDGQYFFDTDHPANIDAPSQYPVQSNLFGSKPLTSDNYAEVRAKMQSLVGADGLPLGVNPNVLAVPPQLEYKAKTIINADLNSVAVGIDAASQTNVLKNNAEVVVIPDLADEPTNWYLFDTSLPIRPFMFYERQAPQTTQLISPTDENVFKRKKFVYGVDARWIMAPGWWPLAARCEG